MNRIHLKAGEFEFPYVLVIGPTYVESKCIAFETEDIDFDVLCTLSYGYSPDFSKAVPLLDSLNQPVTKLIPVADKKAGIDIDDFHGRYLFMRFTVPAGIGEAESAAHQSGDITRMTANVQFTVDANGAETKVAVEYGETNAYGMVKELPLVTVGADQVAFAVLTGLTGLEHSTTYHWRVKMWNDVGTSYGADQTFNTLTPALPGFANIAEANIDADSCNITADVHPGGAETDLVVQYGPTAAYGDGEQITIIAGEVAVPISIALTALLPGVTYHYRLVGTNAAGVEEGADGTFTTLALAPAILPDHTSTPLVDSCEVEAGVNPMGAETAIKIQYGLTAAYGTEIVCTESPLAAGNLPGVGSATIPNLTPGETYHWRIVATNAIGTTNGPDQTFDTFEFGYADIDNVVANPAATICEITADINPWNSETEAIVEYGLTNAYGLDVPIAENPIAAGLAAVPVTATIPDLIPGTTYHFRIVATNEAGPTVMADGTFQTVASTPSVTVEANPEALATSCPIDGTVNPNGAQTTCKVEYGLTAAYGSEAVCAESPIAAGNDAVSVSANLTPLVANTIYHYRLSATNSKGTVTTADLTFLTPAE